MQTETNSPHQSGKGSEVCHPLPFGTAGRTEPAGKTALRRPAASFWRDSAEKARLGLA